MSAAGGQPRRVYRFSTRAHALWMGLAGLSIVALTVKVAADDIVGVVFKIAVFVVLLAMLGVVAAWAWRSATIVTERGIALRGLLRTTWIAWPDVQAIHVELNPGHFVKSHAPKAFVAVHDRSGGRWNLPNVTEANLASQGMDMESEVAAMREAWHRLRGPDWAPNPMVQRAIAGRDRLLLALSVGFSVSLVVLALGMAVFFVLLFTGSLGAWDRLAFPLLIVVLPIASGLAAGLLTARSSAGGKSGRQA